MKTGKAELPLHSGKAPAWLFRRMRLLARAMLSILAAEYGPHAVLQRLADPYWFQAFGCLLGFDWHSSGLTTTTCGAIKEALKGLEKEVGLWAAGGKGAVSRRTPLEIDGHCDRIGLDAAPLVYASRMSAKVDSAAVQDGYQIYHHAFFFTAEGNWAVVQQGMNEATRLARRYHWLSDAVADFVNEPHSAICAQAAADVLNMVAAESAAARDASAAAACRQPHETCAELERLLRLPRRHQILSEDIDFRRFQQTLLKTYEQQPADFEVLLGMPGVGPKTIRALALASELIYGAAPSFRDPARFAFAHGGKDGIPYPVDREAYDQTIAMLAECLNKARLPHTGKSAAFARLRALAAVPRTHAQRP